MIKGSIKATKPQTKFKQQPSCSLTPKLTIQLYNMAFANTPNVSNNSFVTLSSSYDEDYDVSPYSPLKRRLRYTDLQAVVLSNGAKAYSLRQSAGISLWWTLDIITGDINDAGLFPIRNDPSYPAAARSYIPDALFNQIGMARPEVLKAVELDSFNPLYLLTSIPNIVALWTQLQQIGLAGLAWIREAKARCRLIGPTCGWNWDFQRAQELEIPKFSILAAPQITDDNALGLHFDYSIPAARANTPTSVINDNDSLMENSLLYPPGLLSKSRDMVLHPIFSHYAAAKPDYDVFSQTVLTDNGYTSPTPMDTSDDAASDVSTSSDFSWLSTCNSLTSEAARELFDLHTRMPSSLATSSPPSTTTSTRSTKTPSTSPRPT